MAESYHVEQNCDTFGYEKTAKENLFKIFKQHCNQKELLITIIKMANS